MITNTRERASSRRFAHVAAVLASACLLLGCPMHSQVVRSVEGRLVPGPYVSDEAYASYVLGTKLEAQSDWQGAARAYTTALDADPGGVELWTRLGAVRCRSQSPASKDASPWTAFERAAALDRSYEPLWTGRAVCHAYRGDLPTALQDAKTAVALDPERIEPVLVVVSMLERLGRADEARRWMDGLVIRTPGRDAYRAMLSFSQRNRDAARARDAKQALARHQPSGVPVVQLDGAPSAGPGLPELDDALLLGDFAAAQRLAVPMRLSTAELALRAVSVGRAEWAREQAELVLHADPADADARIAAAVAADLLRDGPALERILSETPATLRRPTPLGEVLLDELLARRIGPEAAGRLKSK